MVIGKQARETRENSVGWMIQRLSRRLDDAMGEHLAPLGLSLPQFAVMMTVLEHDGLSQVEIGRRFAMPSYAISRALDGLEAAGYVRRDDDPASRRAYLVRATQDGLALAPRLFAIVRAVNDDFAKHLDMEERGTLKSLLWRLLTGEHC